VNPKAELANDFQSKRKAVHMGSCKLMRSDLKEKAAVQEANIKVIILRFTILLLRACFYYVMVQIKMNDNCFGAFSPEKHDLNTSGLSVSHLLQKQKKSAIFWFQVILSVTHLTINIPRHVNPVHSFDQPNSRVAGI
jgi:hypothetical protein